MNNISIIIQKAANGYMVTLPIPGETWQKLEEGQIKRQAAIESEAAAQSEVNRMQLESGQAKSPDLKLGKMDALSNVFLFKTGSEVLDFLADKVNWD